MSFSASVIGTVRPFEVSACFCTPVLQIDGSYFLQTVDSDGLISGFKKANINAGELNNMFVGIGTVSVREKALFAFRFPNGAVFVDTKKALGSILISRVDELGSYPYTKVEAFDFIGDQEMYRDAVLETALLSFMANANGSIYWASERLRENEDTVKRELEKRLRIHKPPTLPNAELDVFDPGHKAPRHVAINMEGISRWAESRAMPASAGHRRALVTVHGLVRVCMEHGVEVLSLLAFGSDVWRRPRSEVRYIIALFSRFLRNESRSLHREGIRLRFIGERGHLSARFRRMMQLAEELTARNNRATLVIALDYDGHWDIMQAAQKLAQRVLEGDLQPLEITRELIDTEVSISDLPRPELCILTGGDASLNNFMLWQSAYSELYFTDTLGPDFGEAELASALADFNRHQQRNGPVASHTIEAG